MSIDISESHKAYAILILVLVLGSFFVIPASGQRGENEQLPQQLELGISGIQFSDDDPKAGDNVSIRVMVYNNGSKTIDNLTIVYFIDNVEIGNVTGIEINEGGSNTYNISWEAKEGTHQVSAVLKYKGKMIEGSSIGKELYVEAKPIGDLLSLLASLGGIVGVLLGTIIAQSVIKTIKIK